MDYGNVIVVYRFMWRFNWTLPRWPLAATTPTGTRPALDDEQMQRIASLSARLDRLLETIDSKTAKIESFPRSIYSLLWLLILAPIVWFALLFGVGYMTSALRHVGEYTIWAIGSIGLVLSMATVLWVSSKAMSVEAKNLEDRYRTITDKIESDVRRYIDPSVTYKDNEHDLRLILDGELKAFAADEADKNIIIIGADRLRPNEEKRLELIEKRKEGTITPIEEAHLKYGEDFNAMLDTGKILTRYIHLPTGEELRERTKPYQKSYIEWLKEQQGFLSRNKNYRIVSTPRAPMYGAPKSMIFFRNMMVEVFFRDEGGGFIVTSRSDVVEKKKAGPEALGGDVGIAEVRKSTVVATREALIEGYLAIGEPKGPRQTIYSHAKLGELTAYQERVTSALSG